MSYKAHVISLLTTVSLSSISITPSSASDLQIMDMQHNVVSLVVSRMPIDTAADFSETCVKAHRVQQSNMAWQFLANNFIRPEPTIPILQAQDVRRIYVDSRLLDLLAQDARRKAGQARAARAVKFDEAVDARVAKEVARYTALDKEITQLWRQADALDAKAECFSRSSQACLRLAANLGDAVAIERSAYSQLELEPLAEKGYLTARQGLRDALWKAGRRDEAKALNLELMQERHPEAFRFKKLRYPRETVPGVAQMYLRDLEAIKTRLMLCASTVKFNQILADELCFTPTSKAFAQTEVGQLRQALADYDLRFHFDPRVANFPGVRAYSVTQITAFEDWLNTYDQRFPAFQVCERLTEEEASPHTRFDYILSSEGVAAAKAWFVDNRTEFTNVNQIAHLLALIPYDEQGDILRSDIVEKLRKLEPAFNQVEGIYRFLRHGGGKITAQEFAQLRPSGKRPWKISALKFAQLIGYVPPSMR
jgi:hypothetical protein